MTYPDRVLTSVLGQRVMAEKTGSGTPRVLALHGWRRTRMDWTEAISGLDALALDLPGFGLTPPPPAGWSTLEYARELLPVLDEIQAPVLVGHSFGGRVALHMAAELARSNPEAISRLVLTGVPLLRTDGPPAKPAARFRLARKLNKLGIISDEKMEAARQQHGSDDYRAATGVMREVLVKAVNEDYSEQLTAVAKVGIPVDFVWGEVDTAAPLPMVQQAQQLVPGSALRVVEGSGHLLDRALSAALNETLRAATGVVPQGDPAEVQAR